VRGLYPVVDVATLLYLEGIRLAKGAMEGVEKRLERDPKLDRCLSLPSRSVSRNSYFLLIS